MADKNAHKATTKRNNNFLFANRPKQETPRTSATSSESLLANLSEEDRKLVHAQAQAIREHNAWGLIRSLDNDYDPNHGRTEHIPHNGYKRQKNEEEYTTEQ